MRRSSASHVLQKKSHFWVSRLALRNAPDFVPQQYLHALRIDHRKSKQIRVGF
jgi:hypothetical protein